MKQECQRYVLISTVRNEEAFIEETIQSVLKQTVLPLRWVIVSNNSTDATDRIIAGHARRERLIRHLAVTFHGPRDFRAKVVAFEMGYESVRPFDFDLVGNLDGDVSFDERYMERLLCEFQKNPRLGIGGSSCWERVGGRLKPQISSPRHVSGTCQVFRRRCYEEIGGYVPLKEGGEDSAADVMARMKGWDASSFQDIVLVHNRRWGMARGGVLAARFRDGVVDYGLGKPALAVAAKTVRRIFENPWFLGALVRLAGFLAATWRAEKRLLSDEFVKFIRHEERERFFAWWWKARAALNGGRSLWLPDRKVPNG